MLTNDIKFHDFENMEHVKTLYPNACNAIDVIM